MFGKRRDRADARRAGALAIALAALIAMVPGGVQAARVVSAVPSGEVGDGAVQIRLRFDAAVVPFGQADAPDPATLACDGLGAAARPAGSRRWIGDREWAWDLDAPLPPGVTCRLAISPSWKPLGGPIQGPQAFHFATGGPSVVSIEPDEGATIEEDQHWLLRLNGPAVPDSVRRHAWCEVQGVGERVPATWVEGAARAALLGSRQIPAAEADRTVVLACQRPLPPAAGVRLVWGAGIAAASQPAVVTRQPRRFGFEVRERFTAEFSCERERAEAPCIPLRPLELRFSAPVPRAQLARVRLQPVGGGAEVAPVAEPAGGDPAPSALRFPVPLAENARYRVALPADFRDESGRALANAAQFPLAVATGPMPPLAKFAAAPFGVLEFGPGEPGMLPITLRHVQEPGGPPPRARVGVKRLGAEASDRDLLQWYARVARHHESNLTAREAGLPPKDWTVTETVTGDDGRPRRVTRDRMVGTRELSLLAGEADVARTDLPVPASGTGRAPGSTEVIGLPLARPGYHVVEVSSQVLGRALLDRDAPMHVRTGVLVTSLGVHFKRGRTDSLVWVTTLDRARPVAGADVAVSDCRGVPLWSGRTDAQGLARIPRGFEEADDRRDCLAHDGLFVTARGPAGVDGARDLAFVFGDWSRGIESWRFGLPTARGPLGDADAVRAHTVFDRTLLRVGETVSMRHHLRRETARGLARLTGAAQPDTVEIVHQATGESVTLPYRPSMAWTIPAGAKTGVREVTLRRRDGQAWASGQFRVEAFRVPLVEARMQAPEGPQVAPRELAFAVQLRHQSGGGLSAPVALNALLRPAYPQFPDHGDYSFTPPAEPGADGGDGEAPDRVREQVLADRQALRTDAQGAGTARLALPEAVRALKVPAEVVAEVSFDDPNGERQTVGRTVTLWPASVVVGLRARSWLAQGGRVPVQMVVLDPAGRPQAGQEVELRGERRSQTATRQKIVGGFYAYDTKEQVKDLGRLCGGRTDARGLLTCDLDLAETGEVRLIAQARDGTGRASAAATSVWISRGGELWFDQDNDDRIDLLPERRDLRPGETARLQVRMPFREATVLVTVEREGILDARVMTLRGRDPVIEVPVPRASAEAGSWAPNVYVGAMVLRGRVREVPWYSFFQWGWRAPSQWWRAWRDEGPDWVAPTATVDLARPAFKVGTAALRIGLDDHRLTVKVTPEKAQYGIRQTARTAVQVLRPDGQPLAGGTVSFAAVDEGLLALMDNGSWDLLGAMFPPRPWGVETATAHNEIVGRRHHGRKALAPGGGGGRNPTRELFDTLLLWRPEVTLDAQGRATLDVPLNDSLTAFRLVAVAEDGADRFGTGHAAIRVSQDLQMLAGLPSMVREGDRYDALWTLRNTTARAMTVRASLAGPGAPQGAQQVALPAGGAAEVRWPVTVPAGVTTLAWEGAAEEVGGAARDRVRVVQAVEPAVPVRVVQATIRPLAAGAPLSWPVSPPAGALPGV
ncbi:MAG: hypothetical protein RL456_1118, partial [Pseudomonadota bacterium]